MGASVPELFEAVMREERKVLIVRVKLSLGEMSVLWPVPSAG